MYMANVVDQIKVKFGDRIACSEKNPRRYYVDVKTSDLPEVATYGFKDLSARVCVASGRQTPEGGEVLSHFAFDRHNLIVSLRVKTAEGESIPSLTPLMEGANWIEREIYELLGIPFSGHPYLERHLLRADDGPNGVYPLRPRG